VVNICLEDKTAFVTGGSRGIGAAVVKKLAAAGATVGFSYKSNDKAAQALVDELGKDRVKAYRFPIEDDVAVRKSMALIIKELGKIDILVNNAGINNDGFFGMMGKEKWSSVLDVTLNGIYNVTRRVITKMISKKHGVIINMSSISGLVGTPGQVNYSTAKAGVIGFTKALAHESAPYNIRVVCVAPGFIDTDMFHKIPGDVREELIRRIPLGCVGEADDVANLVLFLSSDMAKYITGQVFVIDGGMT